MQHRRPLISMLALTLSLSTGLITACNDDDDATGPASGQLVSPISSDAHIVALLHESNLGEIQAGTLAQQRATDTEVRTFAALMITHHTTLDTAMTRLAASVGIVPVLPDSALPRIQQAEMAVLQATSAGTTFDRVYIGQQIVAHRRTLTLVDTSIARAQRAELRTMLQAQVRPAVAAHLQQAITIQGRIGAP